MTESHELLEKFYLKLIEVVEGDYSDSELTKEVLSLRDKIDHILNSHDKIRHYVFDGTTDENDKLYWIRGEFKNDN